MSTSESVSAGGRWGAAVRTLVFGTAVLALLAAGLWSGVRATDDVLGGDRVRGSMAVSDCATGTACTGAFTPSDPKRHGPETVRISRISGAEKGEVLLVAVRPGTDQVVRTGTAGLAQGWVAMGGALLLAALVAASGLGRRRSAWTAAGLGALLLVLAFLSR